MADAAAPRHSQPDCRWCDPCYVRFMNLQAGVRRADLRRPVWPTRCARAHARRVVAGLWLVVLVTVVAAGLTPLSTDRLTDSDDYMRFVRVFTWLDGASWYDQVEPRLTPPQGGEISWSRAVDLPLAAFIVLLEPHVGRSDAAMWAATIVPALLLLALLAGTVAMTRPFAGRSGAPTAALVALLLPNLVRGTLPGRVDHHGWQLLLVAIVLAALLRTAVTPRQLGAAILAGAALAAGLWIGGESAPWLALYNAVLAGLWIIHGGPFLLAGLASATTTFILSVAILPIAMPPAGWSTAACDSFSIVYVGLAAGALLFWMSSAATGRRTVSVGGRLAAAAIAAAVAGGGWIALFPRCLAGPYADIDPRLATDWLPTIGEAQGLLDYAVAAPGTAAAMILSPVIALGTSIVVLSRDLASARRRRLWYVAALAVGGTLGLACWQIRVTPFANLAAVPVLAWLVVTAWRSAPSAWPRLRRMLAAAGVLIAVGPLGTVFGAIETSLSSDGTTGTASELASGRVCDLRVVAPVLNDPDGLGARRHVIAAPVDLGAELLFRTPHSVIGAPYHRNADGILAIQELFAATVDSDAATVLRRYGADLLLFCLSTPEIRLYRMRAEGKGLADRLVGGTGPEWAIPLALPERSGARLFQLQVQ